jgi:uncharacterized membrane protein
MQYALPYIATLVIFAGIDLIWLGVIAKGFYRAQLGDLMAPQLNIWAAVAFYLTYAAGLVIFAIRPAMISGAWTDAALFGAMFGAVAYATYDLTNLASLRNWPVILTVVDVAWGTLLSAMAAALAFVATRSFALGINPT